MRRLYPLTLAIVRALPIAFMLVGMLGCVRQPSPSPSPASSVSAFTLGGEVIVNSRVDPTGLRFGGLSGMISLGDGRELLALSDDSDEPRVLRLRIAATPAWSVDQLASIRLEQNDQAPARLDPEGIALTADGHMLVASEGISTEIRLPPSITEYSSDGRFIRQLPVRPRFVQNPTGALSRGVRTNAGFESLTTTPDFSHLFTASEVSLLQDGDGDPFSTSPRTRLLEYVEESGGAYQPAREFVYELDPLPRPAFRVGFAVNGLVELLALNRSELIAMERAFIESDDKATTINRIRLFRINLEGASDISAVDTLSGATGLKPPRKVPLLDLAELPGLSARLAGLDNFEGLAWGVPGPDGVRSLILVSDDNFNVNQVTAFLFLRPREAVGRVR